jgi:hypothetical protein
MTGGSGAAGPGAAPEAGGTPGAIVGPSDSDADDGDKSDSLGPPTPPEYIQEATQHYSDEELGTLCPDFSLHYMQ